MPEPTIADLMTAIQGVAAAVAGLDTRMVALETRMTALETRMTALETRVTSVEARMDRVETAIERNSEAIIGVRTATMDRIDRMQAEFEQLRSEMTVNWATADTAIRHGRDRQDEIRGLYDIIGGLQRQYRLLAVRVDDLSLRKH